MAIIRALKGFRYNQNKISNISDVIAPPYDVINSDQQKKLLNSSEHNVVHIDFNDGIGDEKYNLSKNKLNQWFESEILIQENKHAIYPYLQKFEFMNETYQRFGIMCLVKLEEFNKRVILPHEQTFSGPKEDRLKLIRACRTNLSPIFGVFDDSDNKFNEITYDKINNLKPIIDAQSLDGIANLIWKIDDESMIKEIEKYFIDKEILIADGHHRYETSLNYMKEIDTNESKFALFYLAGSNQKGLLINPTHRILQNVSNSKEIISNLANDFIIIEDAKNLDEISLQPDEFIIISNSENKKIKCKIKEQDLEKFYSMSVYATQELIIHKYNKNYDKIEFFKSLEDAKSSIIESSLGVILPKFIPSDIMRVVLNNDKMPQKSTYFYPKVATGMVFNKLY